MDDLTRAEYDQWQDVCRQLKACGAVTDKDLSAPVGSTATHGQRLLTELRFWGDLRARQGVAKGKQQAAEERS